MLLGSPTLHHGMLRQVSGYLTYLEGLRPPGKAAAVFGSFGWSGGATKNMAARLEAIGFEMPVASPLHEVKKLPESGTAVSRTTLPGA